MSYTTVTLINLETAETIEADQFQLRSRGMPDGYVVADGVTTKEWIEAIQKAKEPKA